MNKSRFHALAAFFAFACAPQVTVAQPSSSSDTAASQQLEALRSDYTRRYGDVTRFVVIDPDRLEALPRWMTARTRYNELFSGTGLQFTDQQADEFAFLYLTRVIGGPYSEGNDDIAHIDLGTKNLDHVILEAFALAGRRYPQYQGQRFCLISPVDPDFNALPIPTLDAARTLRFINRHEFWHCLQEPVTTYADPRIMEHAEGTLPLHLYAEASAILRREARADLGAAGDAIAFDNEETALIDVIAHWRQDRLKSPHVHDVYHYSSFALRALKHHIDTIGVTAWRAMDDSARMQVIDHCVDTETMNAAALREYLLTVNGAFTLSPMFNLPTSLIDVSLTEDIGRAMSDSLNAARHFAGYQAASAAAVSGSAVIILNDRQRQALANWDATALLTRTAGTKAITPDSLRQARVALLDGLRAKGAANPDDPLAGACIVKLEQAYQALQTPQLASAASGKTSLTSRAPN